VNRERVVNIVRQRLNDLYNNWKDFTRFTCSDGQQEGNYGIQYCTEDAASWTPSHLRDWDHATSAQVMLTF
jgi:hypothetical protein